MNALLVPAILAAFSEVRAESTHTPVRHLNELVFRHFIVRSINMSHPRAVVLPECRKIDLVVHENGEIAFLELKFLAHTEGADPESLQGVYRKGFPGLSNRRQFVRSVEALRMQAGSRLVHRCVALFYADPVEQGRQSYASWYESKEMLRLCRLKPLVRVPAFLCGVSGHRCSGGLFALRA